ncbi:type IV conjugative transfer system pilin TraA [Vibrio cyclitrophicus]
MQVKKTPLKPLSWLAGAAILSVALAQPALAADLFTSGKAMVKETAGDDSGIETAMLGFSALSAAVVGITSRNWFGAVGGFAGGMMFWEVVKPLVGLA